VKHKYCNWIVSFMW